MTEITQPRKRRFHQIDLKKCLCHVTENGNGKLTPFTQKSWETFQKCADQRKDCISELMESSWSEGPKGGYHRRCYQIYTDKNKVKKSSRQHRQQCVNEESAMPSSPKRARRSQSLSLDLNKCAICQKDKIVTNGASRTREALTLNISEFGSTSLINAAQIRRDNRLLLNIQSQDTIAMEIKYHRSCYKDYVRQRELDKLEERNCSEEDVGTMGYSRAFDSLKSIIEEEILKEAKAIPMSDLLVKYIEFLSNEGISAPSYRSSKLKNRLIRCFGDKLSIRQTINKTQSEIVYSSLVNVGEVVETVIKNSVQDDVYEAEGSATDTILDDSYQIFHTAKKIRNLLVDVKSTMAWPPSPDELSSSSAMIPDLVYNMVAWIILPQPEYSKERVSKISPNAHRLVLSLCQDLIHCVSRGRIKTPKHVALPITVKSLTGNVELITILNRFGHCLSYSQIEELETALAEDQIAKQQSDVLIPSICSPDIPGVFCWDNNDLLEETLSGKGTTHCTNGIIIQRKPHTCELPPDITATKTRSKKRSIDCASSEVAHFSSNSRKGPSSVNIDVSKMSNSDPQVNANAELMDFGWRLCRQPYQDGIFDVKTDQSQVIPAWTGFNTILQADSPLRECTIGYCEVIDASPTEIPTVYTLLQRSLKMADQLGQQDVIVVFDQAIYAKVLEIVWQNQDELQRLVVRMGTFHTTCAFLAAIGKRFGDAGLADVLLESEVVGAGSIAAILEGRHYNRAIRIHKIVFEALHRLQWKGFKSWLLEHGHPVNYVLISNQIMDIRNKFSKEKFDALLSMNDFVKLMNLYKEYSTSDNGPMKKFWNSYLEMVQVLLNAIRATREGNWNMHIESCKDMLPWFFAYDHTNYSRYLPVYLSDMMLLEESHPQAYNMLSNGDFGVQRTTCHGFSQVPVDQAIEQTLNRSTKTRGGIVGFSLKKGAVQRWMLTAHSRAAFVDSCRSMTGPSQDLSQSHKEAGPTRIKRDEEDVQKVIEVIESWRNPFDSSEDLVVLSSGRIADKDVKQDLLEAKQKGKQALESFIDERLVKKSTGFFETLNKLKLGSFRDTQKKTSLKAGERNLFARLLIIGQSRKIDLRELLTFELGPLPWSLASFDGSLAKTNKAALPKLLESGVECLDSLPQQTTAYIIDAMALLQSLVKVPERFGLLAEQVMKLILTIAGQATRIDFVGDQYPEISIKNAEREKRGSSGQLIVQVSSPQQLCPRQWKKFMANGSNKTSLLHFLVAEFTSNQIYAHLIGNRTLFLTHGQTCTRMYAQDGNIISEISTELCSNQEEADTRMFLHAFHASQNGHRRIAIKSSDADVEVLACYYQPTIPSELILISETQSRTRLIHVSKVCDNLGEEVCQVLPSLHALTGCDSVSLFATKEKKKALTIVQGSQAMREAVDMLGERVPLEDHHMLEKFVCTLYNDPMCQNVNELRYKMFCKGKNLQSHQLPPSRAALVSHLKRANFQSYLWKHALTQNIHQTPCNQGWQMKEGYLEIDWTDQPPAPEAVMALVSCGCKGECRTQRCSCVRNNLPCTEACACDNCCNSVSENDTAEDDEDDDE